MVSIKSKPIILLSLLVLILSACAPTGMADEPAAAPGQEQVGELGVGEVAEEVVVEVAEESQELTPLQQEIADLQASIDENSLQWQAGETSLSSFTDEELTQLCGERSEESAQLLGASHILANHRPALDPLPVSWDWRDDQGDDWTTPIRDQGACGSCVAFASLAVLESLVERSAGNPLLNPDLSESDLFACGCGNCCNRGWFLSQAARHLRFAGVTDEACWLYMPQNQSCQNPAAVGCERQYQIASYRKLTSREDMKRSLVENGPLLGRMDVYRDFARFYNGGIYSPTPGSRRVGGHAVAIVGYDDVGGYWVVKNSWGTGWGESGYFRIAYGASSIDVYAYELRLSQSGTGTPGGMPTTGIPREIISFPADVFAWHDSSVVIDADTSALVTSLGDACPGGDFPCDDPGYLWLPTIRVGENEKQLPETPFEVTQEWIGDSGLMSIALGDTYYADNTGQCVVVVESLED